MTIFHERLKILYEDARDKDHRIGRKDFAKICGLSKTSVDNYLNGVGWPKFINFCKLCERLGVNASWMIGQSDIKYNFEAKFAKLSKELSTAEMIMVEEYVDFLKCSAKQRSRNKSSTH